MRRTLHLVPVRRSTPPACCQPGSTPTLAPCTMRQRAQGKLGADARQQLIAKGQALKQQLEEVEARLGAVENALQVGAGDCRRPCHMQVALPYCAGGPAMGVLRAREASEAAHAVGMPPWLRPATSRFARASFCSQPGRAPHHHAPAASRRPAPRRPPLRALP